MSASAPDGGWGWMVVFAFFCISVITDGIRYSFGVMFISFLEAFGKGKGETAWIGGLLAGFSNAVGPLVTKMADRFGCRPVAIAGSLIASAGLFTSVFAQELYQLYITLGVMTGWGYGMIFLTSLVSVSRYFDKKRSLAMGISVCGSGIGSIIFNPLCKWLLDEFGWRGTLLIEAGLVLNCVAFSALYRPLPSTTHESNKGKRNEENSILSEKVSSQENGIETKGNDVINNGHLDFELKVVCHEDKRRTCQSENEPDVELNESSSFLQISHTDSTKNKIVSDVPDTFKKKSNLKLCMKWSRELFRFSLLKDPSFLVFFTSGFLISLAYNIPYTYLPDLAIVHGYTKTQGVMLISYLGIANTISRVLFGILGDRPQVNRVYVYSVTNIICGVFTAFVAIFTEYGLLVMYAVVYGMTTGGYVALSTLVAGDLFSFEVLTESLGLFMLACGLATFIGAPFAGWLFDITRSYALSFITTGVMIGLSGTILFIIPCIRHAKGSSK